MRVAQLRCLLLRHLLIGEELSITELTRIRSIEQIEVHYWQFPNRGRSGPEERSLAFLIIS